MIEEVVFYFVVVVVSRIVTQMHYVMVSSSIIISLGLRKSATKLESFCLTIVFQRLFLIKSSKTWKQKSVWVTVAFLHFYQPTFIPNLFHALWLWKRIVYKMKNGEIIVVNLFLFCFNVKKFLEKIEKLSKRGKKLSVWCFRVPIYVYHTA